VLASGLAVLVGGLGVANGGFFPTSWGIPAIAAAAVVAVALLRPSVRRPGRLSAIWIATLCAFTGWTALALVWTDSVPRTVLELERVLLYVVAAAAVIVLANRDLASGLAAGVVAAATLVTVWNLAVRASGAGTDRGDIARPLGYANGLAILAAIGALLACGLALSTRKRSLRLAAVAPLAVFAPELVLSSSNGAWGALVAGGLVTLGMLRRSAIVSAVVAVAVVGLVAGALIVARHGNPRTGYWSAAWSEYRAAPVLGTGPGTFGQAWLRYRSNDRTTSDAHSLYLETLGESGPLGLALLGAALLVPFAAAVGAGRDPLAAGATGAYAAFVLHAGLDFDWELPAVTIAGLVAGAVVLLRGQLPGGVPVPVSLRAAGIAVAVAIAGFSFVTLVGNRAVAAGTRALAGGDRVQAAARARLASSWLPWDSRPWERLGFVELARGNRRAAAASFRHAIALDPYEPGLWFDLAGVTTGSDARYARMQARRLDPRSQTG
jgi:O-antigen ligase